VAHILYPVRLQSLTPLHLDDANNPESWNVTTFFVHC
jgi:hypothetical protein